MLNEEFCIFNLSKNGFPNDITTYSLVSGLWTAFCSLGEILGPIFGGFLTENFGFETSSSAMGCSALFMVSFVSETIFDFIDFKLFFSNRLCFVSSHVFIVPTLNPTTIILIIRKIANNEIGTQAHQFIKMVTINQK